MTDPTAHHEHRPTAPRWTHVALRVADIDATVEWYTTYTTLEMLDRHENADGWGAWLAHRDGGEHPFVLVIAQFRDGHEPFAPEPIARLAPFNHLGIELPTRDDVDNVAARADAAGCLAIAPRQMPPPIDYICMLEDPDGNLVEFSYDQGIYEKVRSVRG